MKNFRTKLTKQMSLILLTILMVTVITGCTKAAEEDIYSNVPSETSHYPVTVTDFFGQAIVIEEEPQTIISMAPELTETIYALGLGDRMIGRSQYCDYPLEVESVETFGSLFEINIEALVEKEPDIVFLSSMASEEVVTALKDQGLTVLAMSYKSDFEGTYAYMLQIGQIFNREEEANVIVDEIKATVGTVTEKIQGQEAPTVYYVVGAGEYGDYTATGDTFVHGILTLGGGDNIAKDSEGWSYSLEQIIEKDPTYIFCADKFGMKEQLETTEGYKELTAVKEGRIYEIDDNMFSRQGPRVGLAVETVAKILFPDQFK